MTCRLAHININTTKRSEAAPQWQTPETSSGRVLQRYSNTAVCVLHRSVCAACWGVCSVLLLTALSEMMRCTPRVDHSAFIWSYYGSSEWSVDECEWQLLHCCSFSTLCLCWLLLSSQNLFNLFTCTWKQNVSITASFFSQGGGSVEDGCVQSLMHLCI